MYNLYQSQNAKRASSQKNTRGFQIPCYFKLKIFIIRLRNYKIRTPRQILRQITGLTFLLAQSRKFPFWGHKGSF